MNAMTKPIFNVSPGNLIAAFEPVARRIAVFWTESQPIKGTYLYPLQYLYLRFRGEVPDQPRSDCYCLLSVQSGLLSQCLVQNCGEPPESSLSKFLIGGMRLNYSRRLTQNFFVRCCEQERL